MRFRKRCLRLPAHPAAFAVAALSIWAFATPAAAADKDFRGWFAALDLALTQPNSLDQHFASRVDSLTPEAVVGERLVLENDSDATFRASVGYNFGLDLGSLQVSYWSFDNDDSQTGTVAGALVPTIFGYGYNLSMYISNPAFAAGSSVKASTADLDYTRSIEVGDNFKLRWLAGLRVASYEEEQAFAGTDGTYSYFQDKRIDADALGLRVGATGVFDFTEHFRLEGGMSVSFLQGNTKGKASEASDSTFFCIGGVAPCSETLEGEDEYVRGEIRDLDLRAVWGAGPVDVSIGYSASFWDGLVKDPVPANGASGFSFAGEGPSRDGISFNSLHVGILWKFGGGRFVGAP